VDGRLRHGRLQRTEVDALERARAILERAGREAEAIVETAQRRAIEIEATAAAEGRAAGSAEVLRRWAVALQAVEAWCDRQPARLGIHVRRAVERILDCELEQASERVDAALRSTLRLAAACTELVLEVHPDDEARVRRLAAQWDLPPRVHIRTSPAVERGGCRGVNETGTIDARLSTQLAVLEATWTEDACSD
jgi:flagellar biosynthesis/type III secretory pathway protein FliH